MERWLERLARWNVLVAGVAFMLGAAGYAGVGRPLGWGVLAWLGAGAWWGYTLDRRLPFSPEDRSPAPHPRWWILGGGMAGTAWVLWGTTLLPPSGDAVLAAVGLAAAAYVVPVLPGRRRLKDIPYAKVGIVSIGWGLATVALPAAAAGAPLNRVVWLLTGYRTLYLLPNLLLADWPDRAADLTAGIRTPANQWPTSTFVRICRWTCFAAAAAVTAGCAAGCFPPHMLGDIAGSAAFYRMAQPPLPNRPARYRVTGDVLAGWPGIPALLAAWCR